jgi:hypothetical protein
VSDVITQRPEPGWSRKLGLSVVGDAPSGKGADPGHDRVLIMDRVFRYAWGFDERNVELLGQCFTADGVWEGSVMGTEAVGPFTGREAITGFLGEFWPNQVDQRRHVFTNVIIDDYTGTSAQVHAYLLLMSSMEAQTTPVTVGPYRLDLVKETNGVWRISHLRGGWDSPF